ncbi:hypothetical protein QFX18_10905 [Saccharophagus degradans]|uniref:hypothetical protein n=1 Tax=Saccharophagus degradans TaxID=86304 RepID=UPI00247828DE|nr:hypothetical protein [Saccharophagus degradans]WGO96557.1 hypothetical protein QFX18_10905 [Saccharophagus degradans]
MFLSDETRKVDESVFRSAIGIPNRRLGKSALSAIKGQPHFKKISPPKLTSGKSPLIDYYAHPRIRLLCLVHTFDRFLKQPGRSRDDLSRELSVGVPSWEFKIFTEYAGEILLSEDTYHLPVEGTVNNLMTTPELKGEWVGVAGATQACTRILIKANDRCINEWHAMSEQDRQLHASVFFAVATVLGFDKLVGAFSVFSGMDKYFSQSIKLGYFPGAEQTGMDNGTGCETTPESVDSGIPILSSHKDWYAHLQQKLDDTFAAVANTENTDLLVEAVIAYQKWAGNTCNPSGAYAALKETTGFLVTKLASFGIKYDLLGTNLYRLWELWAHEQPESPDDALHEWKDAWTAACERITTSREALEQSSVALDAASVNLGKANGIIETRRLQQEQSEYRTQHEHIKNNLFAAETYLIESALPAGSGLDLLEEPPAATQPAAEWPSAELLSSIAGLRDFLHAQENSKEPEPNESASDNPLPGTESIEPRESEHDVRDVNNDALTEITPLPFDSSANPDVGLSADTTADFLEQGHVITPDIAESLAEGMTDASTDITEAPNEKTVVVPEIDANSEEGRSCLEYMHREAFIPGEKINAAMVKLIANHQIPMAAQISYLAENAVMSQDFIPAQLLKSAYYGMNTFNRTAFDKSRRELLRIKTGQLAEWCELPNSEFAPYLMFLASFQPALFGGNTSTATLLLRELPDNLLDNHTQSLIDDVMTMANRGEPITLSALRTVGKAPQTEPVRFDNKSLVEWRQKIRESRRGYAPVLKSLAHCLDQGIFQKITAIILADDRQNHHVVEDFVETYADQDASNRLLADQLAQINMYAPEGVTKLGKQRFHHKVTELAHIARDWLDTTIQSQGSTVEDFCKRFHTRLPHVIQHFQKIASDQYSAQSRRAGAEIVAYGLLNLQRQITSPNDDAWSYRRLKGWYYVPRDICLLHVTEGTDIATTSIKWLFERMGTDVFTIEPLQNALEKQNFRLAELLRLHLAENGEQAPGADTLYRFQSLQRDLSINCRELQAKLEDALLAGLIESDRAEVLSGQLSDSEEAIEQLSILDETEEIQATINQIDLEMRDRLSQKKEELIKRFEIAMFDLNKSVTENPAPEGWLEDLNRALEDDNIPVAGEMLDELENAARSSRRIERIKIKDIPVYRDFVESEKPLYERIMVAINGGSGKKGIKHAITNAEEELGLRFNGSTAQLKTAADAMAGWYNSKPQASMNQDMYLHICAILDILGIVPSETQFNNNLRDKLRYLTTTGFSCLKVPVGMGGSPSTRPFTTFGEKMGQGSLPVMIAYKQWRPENLLELMDSHKIHGDSLLISAVPMTSDQRAEFASYFKGKHKTVFHVDLVVLLFLASITEDSVENIAVRNFLWLTAPHTYFNPYGGNTLKPPLPEMRYGRSRQIDQLLRMENGAAIVYGGRQLGKSTILQEVQHRFRDHQQNKYAFYSMLDRDLKARIDITPEAHNKARRLIWESMYYELFVQNGLIPKSQTGLSIDDCMQAVKQTIIQRKDCAFIVIFDEIDPILNVDSHYDFSIFRGLRDLVAHHEVMGRFKVIIGGLENVKRFENSPNYPLTQMGSTTPVEILPAQEAIHLVKEPLLAAGYRFENDSAVNRILAVTNRHPGLIQVFCHELIDYLCANRKFVAGGGVITNQDVGSVSGKQEVRELIRERFDMTLNLDNRYLVIIYGIIEDGRGAQPFNVEYAKDVADIWLPEAFAQLSSRQFEAFLEELIGLGVLRKNNDGRYALRNTNVLKLLVDIDGQDVGKSLERAIESYQNYDPLDRHAYIGSRDSVPSPITYRDERTIIGIGSEPEDNANILPDRTHRNRYATSIVVGSEAQGLLQLEHTLPAIYEEEHSTIHASQDVSYQKHVAQTSDYASPIEFETKLLKPLLTMKCRRASQMAFIRVSTTTTIPDLLGLLDAAHAYGEHHNVDAHPVRIVFLMDPPAYWKWLSHSDLTRGRESLQPFIKLTNWTPGAVRALLERLGMTDSNNAVREVMNACQGWYHSLQIIAKTRHDHSDWTDIKQFRNFHSLTEMNERSCAKFLKLTGAHMTDWALPILKALVEQGNPSVDIDYMHLIAEEAGVQEVDSDRIRLYVRWLMDTGLLVRARSGGPQVKSINYSVAPAVEHSIQVAAIEHSA